VTHASFDEEGGETFGMNTFVGLVGWSWY